ncbi:MAG: carboxylating nicotinate-nucleotide diphosphorylase [Candidatus Methanomethylophilaceae archaeon]|nr:carboxylating nicotinate-nucleotide diphosphorylase [Candidatus Methanomethylophilaceae archaeon]MDD3127880.1 carboxylating nicotinate-nucleotide diphosphorylase [Candidatus Methanomethylophilaceae archaeon]MDD4119032.1 carboxylating nicotinate-nucleotide diphosphorylase [Candidatus Methanomethylophilaceae archaeon]MDD4454280.1 carboxylating nicotinate-nucleotide diphosphorylase [Candidatus Methanomethylophilaceae archaeon]
MTSEKELIAAFLAEDVRTGDITTELTTPDSRGRATIHCEENAVVAGLRYAGMVFELMGVDYELIAEDGSRVEEGQEVMRLEGPLRGIMSCERTALNIIMRMSGIATATAAVLESCRARNPKIRIAGTRKTTPGFRYFEKAAIAMGGGEPHRFALDDMMLIKDNHIKAAGGVAEAMEASLDAPYSMKVEIEVDTVEDAMTAAKMGADIIMVDNRTPEETARFRDAIKAINEDIIVEASGGITAENAPEYSSSADMISMGSLTHSVRAVQFSLDII